MRSTFSKLSGTFPTMGRFAIAWTVICVALSVTTSLMLMRSGPEPNAGQVIVVSALIPILMVLPLLVYSGVRIRQLRIDNLRLGRVARTDSLTACLNRGAFTSRVEEWLDRPGDGVRGALLIIDADNFKAINDLYGHHAGDEALTIIARSIRSVLRTGDIVGRMGGEEFGVFLPDVSEDHATLVAERIRRSVNLALFTPEDHRRELSVSIGGAVFSHKTSFAELFRIADQRLYGAKHAGRNVAAIVQVEDHPAIRLRKSA